MEQRPDRRHRELSQQHRVISLKLVNGPRHQSIMQIAVSAAIKRLKGIGQRPPMNVRCNALASGRVPQLQLEETSGFGCGRLDDQARSALERSARKSVV